MKQQEAFEAWATSQQINITRDGFGGYESEWTEGASEGWQAAQAQTAFEDGSTPEYRKGFSDGLKEVDLPTMKGALDAGDGCLHSTIDNLRHEVGRQKVCILELCGQVQHLVADQVAMQDQLRVYQAQAAAEPVGYTNEYGMAYAVKWSGALPPRITLYATPPAHTEAMRLALEALKFIKQWGECALAVEKRDTAIAALEKELAP